MTPCLAHPEIARERRVACLHHGAVVAVPASTRSSRARISADHSARASASSLFIGQSKCFCQGFPRVLGAHATLTRAARTRAESGSWASRLTWPATKGLSTRAALPQAPDDRLARSRVPSRDASEAPWLGPHDDA